MGVRVGKGQDRLGGASKMVADKYEGKEWSYMQDKFYIPTFWKSLNIIYGTWNCILSTNKASQKKRGENLSKNVIQIRVGAVNKKRETKRLNKNLNGGLLKIT